eukprot:2650974-Rhodomonas_salina.1
MPAASGPACRSADPEGVQARPEKADVGSAEQRLSNAGESWALNLKEIGPVDQRQHFRDGAALFDYRRNRARRLERRPCWWKASGSELGSR